MICVLVWQPKVLWSSMIFGTRLQFVDALIYYLSKNIFIYTHIHYIYIYIICIYIMYIYIYIYHIHIYIILYLYHISYIYQYHILTYTFTHTYTNISIYIHIIWRNMYVSIYIQPETVVHVALRALSDVQDWDMIYIYSPVWKRIYNHQITYPIIIISDSPVNMIYNHLFPSDMIY